MMISCRSGTATAALLAVALLVIGGDGSAASPDPAAIWEPADEASWRVAGGHAAPRHLGDDAEAEQKKRAAQQRRKRAPRQADKPEPEPKTRLEVPPTFDEVLEGFARTVVYFLGFAAWLLVFLLAWEGSIVPGERCEALFGAANKPHPGLGDGTKNVVISALLSAYLSVVMWLCGLPPEVRWRNVPNFCVQPRTWYGLVSIHHAPFHHTSRRGYTVSSFALWLVTPLVVSYGKRTFAFSFFFIAFVSYFFAWLVLPGDECACGLGPVLSGWMVVVLFGLPFQPLKVWRVVAVVFVVPYVVMSIVDAVQTPTTGESALVHYVAMAAGGLFAILHFGLTRATERFAFGRFEGFEEKAQKAGRPWPGWGPYWLRVVTLLTGIDVLEGCCRARRVLEGSG